MSNKDFEALRELVEKYPELAYKYMADLQPPSQPQQRKTRVLAYCDSPTCATGFGTVSRNIFEGLVRTGKYDINVFGINYWGDPHPFPYRIWPAGTNPEKDPYGRQKATNMIPRMEFDILFFLQDTFILNFLPVLMPHLKMNLNRPFASICYFPVDSILKQSWADNVGHIDNIVAYTEFGRNEVLKHLPGRDGDVISIPHGVNVREYHPIDGAELSMFKKKYFGRHAEKFIITNLNRNQQRKDIPRTIMAFKKFKEMVPDSILYLHMAKKDQGWDLVEVCKDAGLDLKEDVVFPENFSPNQGYPRHIVNALYNCSDVVVSTTLGEGFGFSWIEAMATKTPVIMPNNTAMSEFITEDRGYLVNSGTDNNLWTMLTLDNEVYRPLVDVDDLVAKLLHVYNNPEEATQKAENAYDWVINHMDWQGAIASSWVSLFDSVANQLMAGHYTRENEDDFTVKSISAEEV